MRRADGRTFGVVVSISGLQAPASQSLARDLTLSEDYELLQQFVPELQVLRLPSTACHTEVSADSAAEQVFVAWA